MGERSLSDDVKIEKGLGLEGRVAIVRFDRGDGVNALSPEAIRQLTEAARSFEDDGETSVVVLTGGPGAFSAGFDLKDAEGRSRRDMDLGALRRHLKLGPRLARAWQEMEQVTIGAIEGFAIGGGVSLAVALDFRIMASDAHVRLPEVALGMNMSWQSIPRMLHLIGPARTKQAVLFASERIPAAQAYEWGLVEQLAEPGRALETAMEWAAKIAAQPPLTVAMTKLTVNRLAHALDASPVTWTTISSRSRASPKTIAKAWRPISNSGRPASGAGSRRASGLAWRPRFLRVSKRVVAF